MRTVSAMLLLSSLSAGFLHAQRPAKVDVGIHAGATILIPSSGSSEYVLGLPGGGGVFGLLPPVYATFFAGPNLMVEPQVAFVYQSFSDAGLLNATLQVGYLIRPGAGGSPYFAGHLFSANSFGEGSGSEFAAGASLGYRHVVKDVLGLRYEARYRRWFDADLNEVALLVGFGVVLR